ncbi:Uracil-DNA glycosylase [Candidatus Erwinia haradaeae]|uniref:Uracil-DNA glycosylase n=1 Tax=Candidatus Erwinia haradaeae TaxID=1922217 RepID=A0A451DKJ6_9GAMM|nr:uracil-DNA glycosylase [Candidatus Erwinia haradaeae]VFP87237.1 Uracil-DNA glycosylase [Candidatus Erwinia haradaeae]
MMSKITWRDILSSEKEKLYFKNIIDMISRERSAGKIIYPPTYSVFNAFSLTELWEVKIVILGQDPYHGPHQAHGLAFSVPPHIAIPPSLRNIYKELLTDIPGFRVPSHGFLKSWARQGVLLLNTILTVESGKPRSHMHFGWEVFTNRVISVINEYCENIIFLLWGSDAQKRVSLINDKRHYILMASHPSPLSAHRGFFGCSHFSKANQWLNDIGKMTINWFPELLL